MVFTQTLRTLSTGARYAILVPSGEIVGLALTGFPKMISLGISSACFLAQEKNKSAKMPQSKSRAQNQLDFECFTDLPPLGLR
jgi:hypothetical protein